MQKPFRFSSFSFFLIAFGFALYAFSTTSCNFNPNKQTPGQGYLQGEWQQDSVAGQKQLITYSLYHIRFSCDSFFMAINSVSKVNSGADSCMNSGHWAEYSRGGYEQQHDTIYLKGQFVNANMTIKDDKGCFRSGDYAETFKVIKKTDSLVQFSSITNVIPINLRLVKKTSCIPKPL
jgi:hypothetical protein